MRLAKPGATLSRRAFHAIISRPSATISTSSSTNQTIGFPLADSLLGTAALDRRKAEGLERFGPRTRTGLQPIMNSFMTVS
jgi:hypothetical protein